MRTAPKKSSSSVKTANIKTLVPGALVYLQKFSGGLTSYNVLSMGRGDFPAYEEPFLFLSLIEYRVSDDGLDHQSNPLVWFKGLNAKGKDFTCMDLVVCLKVCDTKQGEKNEA